MQSQRGTHSSFGSYQRFAPGKTPAESVALAKQVKGSMKSWIIAAAGALIGVLPLVAQTPSEPQDAHQQKQTKWVPPASPDRGQQVFEQNCSRCHNPPEGFSSRVSGTVALHMRVRANLSAADYKALLHFLNP